MFKKIDWSKVFSYTAHIGLMAGAIALQTYAPGAYAVWGPLFQVAGQALPTPEGVTLLNKDDGTTKTPAA